MAIGCSSILEREGRRDILHAMMAVKRSGDTVGPRVNRVKNLCAQHGLALEETIILEEEAKCRVQQERRNVS